MTRRSVRLRVSKRIVVDVRALAEHIGRYAVDRIRELAAKGRGYKGAFAALKDSTIDRYHDDPRVTTEAHSAGRSTLRRTGALLDGLQWRVVPRGEGRMQVRVEGGKDQSHPIGMIDSRRPFLGLSPADLRRANATYDTAFKAKRGRG